MRGISLCGVVTKSPRPQPVDMWTSPTDRPEPYGTCGQSLGNIPVTHPLPTLSGLSPTYPQAQQQQER